MRVSVCISMCARARWLVRSYGVQESPLVCVQTHGMYASERLRERERESLMCFDFIRICCFTLRNLVV